MPTAITDLGYFIERVPTIFSGGQSQIWNCTVYHKQRASKWTRVAEGTESEAEDKVVQMMVEIVEANKDRPDPDDVED